jgi:hypothetical protein
VVSEAAVAGPGRYRLVVWYGWTDRSVVMAARSNEFVVVS